MRIFAVIATLHHAGSFLLVPSIRSPVALYSTKDQVSNDDRARKFVLQGLRSECDNANVPPSLSILLRSIQDLTHSGSDIRGRFVDHAILGRMSSVADAIRRQDSRFPPLTPLAAYCFGQAWGEMLLAAEDKDTVVAIGQDPRSHGVRLADAMARGLESHTSIRVVYTGIATTPACAAFPHLFPECDAAIMVTASHLPQDRNGFKMYTKQGGLSADDVKLVGRLARDSMSNLYTQGSLPPLSGGDAVTCSKWVDWMPAYADFLKTSILDQVKSDLPLKGLKICLNAGNGSGGFFQKVLEDLGADASASIHSEPDGAFPNGVPNPEYAPMYEATLAACQKANADLGIMLDTDADRCGFCVPTLDGYQPLNRNRLIALLAVVFAKSHPGCSIVTDSVTSEGLSNFLTDKLGLQHVRYLKGYANVINKAKQVDAQVGIETSGHCAMKENKYLDDGTYTAVKVVSLLANAGGKGLLDLISEMNELDEVVELRMTCKDLDTMQRVFDVCAMDVERAATEDTRWEMDMENLEGVRVRVGDEQFFMVRKSLHDPIISVQIEAKSKEDARRLIVKPLLDLFQAEGQIRDLLDMDILKDY
jgi:phosphomannomutase